MIGSGILDINGAEICAGDVVRLTIPVMHSKPLIVESEVVFNRGAFRFKDDRENFQSCIGDLAPKVTLEIIK